jgi:O-antigen/teichoic acid export membrane protein
MKAAMVGTVCAFLPWLGRSVRTYLSGTMAAELVFVTVLVAWLFRRRLLSAISFDRALFRSAVGFGLPLVFYELAGVILLTADRALVRYYLGGEALGYYSVAYGLSQYVNDLMTVPLGLAILPIYLRLWSAEGRARTIEFLHLSLDFYLMAAAGIYMLVTLGSHDALVLLASPKYLGADRLIPYLVGGLLIYTTHVFLCAGLLIQKKTGTMALALICSTALNVVLNCVLLPRMGLQGAAVALLLTHIVTILLLWLASSRILPIGVRAAALAKYGAAGLAGWAAASQIALPSHLLNLVCRCAVGIAVYAGALLLLDSRVRSLPSYLLRSRRSQSVEAGIAAEPVLSEAEEPEEVCK